MSAIPDIRITDVQFRSALFGPRARYEVADSGRSILYFADIDSLVFEIEGIPYTRVDPGGLACLVSGRAHVVHLAGAPKQAPLRPLTLLPHSASCNAEPDAIAVSVITVPNTANPIPDVMPPIVAVARDEIERSSIYGPVVAMARDPNIVGNSANEPIVQRLAEIMAIAMTETALERMRRSGLDMRSGLLSSRIRDALSAMHDEPAKGWTLDALADRAHLSRSGFFEQFRKAVGDSPMNYLTRVRMNLATGFLQTEDSSIADIAYRVGYRSTPAFSTAFHKHFGMSPGAYRRAVRDVEPGGP